MKSLKDLLHDHQLSATPQRLALLEYLRNDFSHPEAETIYDNVRGRIPGISKATVYRILEEFCQKGLIRILPSDAHRRRFDGNTAPHHHLVCRNCGNVQDLHDPIKVQLPEKSSIAGFDIQEHGILFMGICADCQN